MNCPRRITYTIRRGDTLARLARRYRTSVELIVAENPHVQANNLLPGQIITICPGYTTLPEKREATPASPPVPVTVPMPAPVYEPQFGPPVSAEIISPQPVRMREEANPPASPLFDVVWNSPNEIKHRYDVDDELRKHAREEVREIEAMIRKSSPYYTDKEIREMTARYIHMLEEETRR